MCYFSNFSLDFLSLKIRILSRILNYNFMCSDDLEYINEVTKRLDIIWGEIMGALGRIHGGVIRLNVRLQWGDNLLLKPLSHKAPALL